MAKQHVKQFKLDAIQYYQDHKEFDVRGCAENLGIGYSTLTKWLDAESLSVFGMLKFLGYMSPTEYRRSFGISV